jgi:quercetin dioxygenase-like cupin family protein
VLEGRLTVRYADREEVFVAGDAFYWPPGHVPAADAGTVFVQFSPTDELAATEAEIAKHMSAAPRT